MAASARIALSFLSIYVLQYVWFASKTTQDHSLNDMLSFVVLRIRVPDRDVNFLAVVRFQRVLSRLLLTPNGHHKLRVAAINLGSVEIPLLLFLVMIRQLRSLFLLMLKLIRYQIQVSMIMLSDLMLSIT